MGWMDRGEITASTIGHWLGTLVDAGDHVVIYEVVDETEPDDNGQFVRRLDVTLVPNGRIREQIKQLGVTQVHKVLTKFLQEGVLE